MAWLRISVVCDKEKAAAIADTLDACGALAVTWQDAADEPLLEPAPGETPLWKQIRLVALFSPEVNAGQVQQAVQVCISMPALDFQIETLEDRDWSATWREDFHAMRFGSRLWVSPGHDVPADPDAVVVEMDPGLAFGTGTHATTAMCLEWLDAHPPVGQRVIDYGCGSGILAIAACKLGASVVYGVDIDPQAIQATRENARHNGVQGVLSALLPEGLPAEPVDLLLANILANPLIDLAGTLGSLVRPGGHLLMTGILEGQAEAVMSAYRPGFAFAGPVCREEWVLLAGRKMP